MPAKASKAKKTTSKKNMKVEFSKKQYFDFYEQMLLIRRFEEKAGQLYGMGFIGGFCHLYIGQEAVVVGLQSLLNDGDTVITSYRDHGHMLACEMDPKRVMAELTGREGGYSKGKGGSMHMFSREKGFYGGHGIVGAQVSLGTGMAFAHQYKEDKGITMAYMGDGAVNQGQVYESFNMASLWNLPVIYVIENNQYAMGTSVKRASASVELFRRGEAYSIPGDRVNGMNVEDVCLGAQKAVDHVRSGKGPYILEMMTYRYRGHSMSDPAKYRSKDEVQDMKTKNDPIEHIKSQMIKKKMATEAELKGIDKKIRSVVAEAAEYAQNCPEPDVSELYTDIFVEA